MSETTTEQGGATPPEPIVETTQDNQVEANDNQVEANDNQPEQTEEQQQRQSREDRRIAQLSARLAAETRAREQLQAEAEAMRKLQLGTGEETEEQRIARFEQEAEARVEARLKRERFHQEGAAEYGTAWNQKCQDLMSMGADPGFAQLLVELPDAVRVTAALADDPEAVQRIAGIRTERGRAIALGRYAASLERAAAAADPPPARAPQITAAPPPVRAITAARAAPAFDPYNPRHTPEQLAEFFTKQEMEKRRARQ